MKSAANADKAHVTVSAIRLALETFATAVVLLSLHLCGCYGGATSCTVLGELQSGKFEGSS